MKKGTKGMTMTAALTVLLLLVTAQVFAALTVTSTADDGEGTLRQALADASDGDTIDFSVNGTIALTSGSLMVDKSVSIIVGPGQDVTLDGMQSDRVLFIAPGKTVLISGLTIANGMTLSAGGGIYNAGTLTLNECTLMDNSATGGGGGVFTEGDLTITGCILSGNWAGATEEYYGGGADLDRIGDSPGVDCPSQRTQYGGRNGTD